MFYVNFINLCAKKNVTPAAVARAIGVSGAAISKWKSGGTPSDVTLVKLADYFKVSVDELLMEEQKKSSEEDLDIDIAIIQRAHSKLTAEDKEKMMNALSSFFKKEFEEAKKEIEEESE
ncbi:MAG: helix-turn-helix transcriptional regulator [Oscillospiraceae bacterium]|nr:helix-turn-helix transcriptional regulator [Oscillospiraceae bacterium]